MNWTRKDEEDGGKREKENRWRGVGCTSQWHAIQKRLRKCQKKTKKKMCHISFFLHFLTLFDCTGQKTRKSEK